MIDYQELVRDFHRKKGVTIHHTPTVPTFELVNLRRSLIREEMLEVLEALSYRRLPEIAKELADVLYVVFGTAVSLGIDLKPVFLEVHRANMTKDYSFKRYDGKI